MESERLTKIFNKFTSLYDLQKALPTEKTCIEFLELIRWNGKVVSPSDKNSKVYKCKNNRYFCKNSNRYFNVDKVTILEPFDKKIIANLGNKHNIYHKLILHMKLDTQTYYNLRIILGLEHN